MNIYDNEQNLLAVLIDTKKNNDTKNFYTSNDLDIQVASFNLSSQDVIERHFHYSQNRNIKTTSEVIYLQSGKIEVEIYDLNKKFVQNVLVKEEMLIILLQGAHAINILEDSKFIEVKQGPYDPENDKERF